MGFVASTPTAHVRPPSHTRCAVLAGDWCPLRPTSPSAVAESLPILMLLSTSMLTIASRARGGVPAMLPPITNVPSRQRTRRRLRVRGRMRRRALACVSSTRKRRLSNPDDPLHASGRAFALGERHGIPGPRFATLARCRRGTSSSMKEDRSAASPGSASPDHVRPGPCTRPGSPTVARRKFS